ncbi:MAG TPA: asparagine synthase-related protein [Herpetosiphonaceae bacterium]
MDIFLAAIRIRASSGDCASLVETLERALQTAVDPATPTATTRWSDQQIAFVCIAPLTASDAACSTADERLIYINGPVASPGGRVDAQPGMFAGPYRQRLRSVYHAAEGWLAGSEELAALSGSFCALYHAPHAARTLVISDRLGSRPIFYCAAADWLYLASDIRPLLRLPGVRPRLDLESVAQFIRYQMILDDRTLYSTIKTVPPATVVAIDHRSGEQQRSAYWSLRPLPCFATRHEAIEATADAFSTAIRRIVADSQRLGLLLSGGFDSRMLLAALDRIDGPPLHAYTFGPSFTEETQVARQVAQMCATPWHFIEQPLAAYWQHLASSVQTSNGLHAAGHMHLYHPTSIMARAGCDTVLNGWGFDLPYSGSYLPKETFRVLGRQLYSYRMASVGTRQAVVDHLHATLDMQSGAFGRSLLGAALQPYWESAPRATLAHLVDRASATSDSPYDWIDYTLMGFGVTKFRSYSMLMNVRSQARERNPLFESDIIEVYQRLPYQWRFLGPVFRRAVRQLNPAVANIRYSNTGISGFAPPVVQALAMQGRATWRSNGARLRHLGQRITGSAPAPGVQRSGSYHESFDMARYFETDAPIAQAVGRLLHSGKLVEAGILDPRRLQPALERCRAGLDRSGFTVMAWVALALWLDLHPAEIA